MKNFFTSKINITALILVLLSLQDSIANLDISKMTWQTWTGFVLGMAIMIFRTFFTSVDSPLNKK